MINKPQSLNQIAIKMFKKCLEYGDFEPETDQNFTKVCFLGLNLNPNTDGIWNFDILYLYKALQFRGIEARIHDPHIKATMALSMGVWMGRQSDSDNWAHGFDVMILSCPHVYYIKNLTQLSQLLKPNKPCMLLDLYGVLSKLTLLNSATHQIDIVDFSGEYKKGELMGGLLPQPRRMLDSDSKSGV